MKTEKFAFILRKTAWKGLQITTIGLEPVVIIEM